MEKVKRTFRERFSRYEPSQAEAKFISSITDYKLMVDESRTRLEIEVKCSEVFPKKVVYSAEEEIQKSYNLKSVRIFTAYDSEAFKMDYIPQLLIEAGRSGVVSRGFFDSYSVGGNASDGIVFSIPFGNGGIDLLSLAETADRISAIIRKEFSIDVNVEIKQDSGYQEFYADFEKMQAQAIREESQRLASASLEAQIRQQTESKNEISSDENTVELRLVDSLFDGENEVIITDKGTVKSGKMEFDVSEAEIITGAEFEISSPVPIRTLNHDIRAAVVLGEVFYIDSQETKQGDKLRITVGITDLDASVNIKTVLPLDAAEELLGELKKGVSIAVKGNVKKERYKRRDGETVEGDFIIQYSDILKVKRLRRKDMADEKRVELHLHTNMSAMDATIKADEIVKTAYNWGHGAVAITDHGNLQSFPVAMNAARKLDGMKVLYGMEAYFVDDTARAVYGTCSDDFESEFVVFDIETTGLSPLNNKITEIGAVKVKKGEVTDKFNMLCNPETPIPDEIVKLTGITDEMVADAPTIDVVLPKFLEFAGDKLLIAHNAGFDTSFIRRAAEDLGYSFENSYLDTVSMSRYVNPELSKHKLNILAEYFELGDFNHHRASDDAEVLAKIFYKMTDKLRDEGILNFNQMTDAMSEKTDPLKLRTYHQIILVKNQTGLKNLYKLVSDSYLKYYRRRPRVPKTNLIEHREGLLIGSACESGELFRAILDGKSQSEIDEIVDFYDYLEIQPICNNRFLIEQGKVADDEELKELNRKIVALGEKHKKPVVATCDAHYMDKEDDIYRRILLKGMKFSDGDQEHKLYFRTTEEMLEEFSYLGEEKCREVVITNPRKIADMIDSILPIPDGNYPPHIDGAEEELTEKCHSLAKEMYGDPLPDVVSERLERELKSIIDNGFAIMYIIARKLVVNSEEKGYQVGSRGSVGSSFAATMAGITKVNSLPPHYRCPKCKNSEFFTKGEIGSGFDLPPKKCPDCGTEMIRDGHDIPFETFLGFYGDKTPDIDLNFSGDVQGDAHKFTEELFGAGKAFKAGTIGTIAEKTAYGYVLKYLEEKGITVNNAEKARLVSGIEGIKKTTGQHPGGIIVVPREYEIYDFCPVQHPADDPKSDIVTTHFEFKYLHDTILKLDILGHDIPTKYKRLEEYTNTNVLDVPLSDAKVYQLFSTTEPLGVTPEQLNGCKTGTLGLPEMGSKFVRGVLSEAQPKTFSDLLQISGLTHGTGLWLGNAQDLIAAGTATISEVIGCRDDIMLTLIHKYDMEKSLSFKITEFVRKNKKGAIIPSEMVSAMREHNVPEWYIESLQKIRYMFPKAHASAYVIDALRLGWYKIYYPMEFYAAYFTAAPDGFDSEVVMSGRANVFQTLKDLTKPGAQISQKDAQLADALQLVNEYYARGGQFLPVSLKKSHAKKFLPENGKIRLPFASLPGLGETAAESLMAARDNNDIYSIDDLRKHAKVSKTVVDMLQRNGALEGLTETNQMTLF